MSPFRKRRGTARQSANTPIPANRPVLLEADALVVVCVVTVAVNAFVLPGVTDIDPLDTVQVAYSGAPEQTRVTVPLNPALPVSARE